MGVELRWPELRGWICKLLGSIDDERTRLIPGTFFAGSSLANAAFWGIKLALQSGHLLFLLTNLIENDLNYRLGDPRLRLADVGAGTGTFPRFSIRFLQRPRQHSQRWPVGLPPSPHLDPLPEATLLPVGYQRRPVLEGSTSYPVQTLTGVSLHP